ncbi:MAG: serine hydrolase [bacterium]
MRKVLFIASALLLSFTAKAQPLSDFSSHVDPALQSGLEKSIDRLGLKGAARQQKLSLALVDITDEDHPVVAMINGDHMMYAASLPKIAILLGAFHRIEEGELTLDDDLRNDLTQMIRYSSNQAATKVLNIVGKEYLAELLQSPRYKLYDPEHNGGLWVGKEYGRGTAFQRDPLHHLSHGATAYQVARFYYMLETGQLVSPKLQPEMKAILGKPGINHKFVKGLNSARPGSEIFRKSGSWRQWHADSAIVERDGHRYIAVGLADNKSGGQWLSKIIVAMDDLVLETDQARSAAKATHPVSTHASLSTGRSPVRVAALNQAVDSRR